MGKGLVLAKITRPLTVVLAGAALSVALAALALPGEALGQQSKPVFGFRGESEPILSAGFGPHVSFNERSGLLHLFVAVRLSPRVDLYVERGEDDAGLIPFSYLGDYFAYTKRTWRLATARLFLTPYSGWYLGAGAVEGRIEQTEGMTGHALIADAHFTGPLLAIGWQGQGTVFAIASLQMARIRTSRERIRLPLEFQRPDFDRASRFSQASFGIGWHLF